MYIGASLQRNLRSLVVRSHRKARTYVAAPAHHGPFHDAAHPTRCSALPGPFKHPVFISHNFAILFPHATDLAKWVGANSASSDSECENAPNAAGSSTATIVGGVAQFAFDGDVETWILCYKHGENNWSLYTGIVPLSTSNALLSGGAAVSDTQRTRADVSFTMQGDISSYPEGSNARTTFLEAFVLDLSRALGVDTSRFTITGVRGGSVVIDFTVEPTG